MPKPLLVIQYVHMQKEDENHFRIVAPNGILAKAPNAQAAYDSIMSLVNKYGYEVNDEIVHV